jgi:hypothetical protein
MRRFRATTFASVLLALLVACSGGSSSYNASSSQKYVIALCERSMRCTPVDFKSSFVDLDDCSARMTRGLQATVALPGVSITSPQFDACTTALAASRCTTAEPTALAACKFVGTLAPQAPCVSNGQCASGLCAHSGAGTCGVCAVPTPIGGDCSTVVCVEGATCNIVQKCVAWAAEGAACNDEKAPCKSPLDCVAGTCQPNPVPPAELGKGAACGSPGYAFCSVEQGLTCIGGTCVEKALASLGQPCDPETGGDEIGCAASVCVGPTTDTGKGTCTPLAQEGAACAEGVVVSGCAEPLDCVNSKCTYLDTASCH